MMPRVDVTGAATTDALDREVLNCAEQLRLRGRRQIGHLVEEQRPFVRVLELAAAAADAGRRPILDAEQLRLEQRLDDRRAVDRDERTLAAATEIVNLTGDQLLARAGFPLDEHCEVRRGHALDPLAHATNRRTRPDERRRPVAAHASEQRRTPLGALDLQQERSHVRGALEHMTRPAIERAARIEHRFDPWTLRWNLGRDVDDQHAGIRRCGERAVVDANRPRPDQRADFLLEPLPHPRDVPRRIQPARHRPQQVAGAAAPIRCATLRGTWTRRGIRWLHDDPPPLTSESEPATNFDARRKSRRTTSIPLRTRVTQRWMRRAMGYAVPTMLTNEARVGGQFIPVTGHRFPEHIAPMVKLEGARYHTPLASIDATLQRSTCAPSPTRRVPVVSCCITRISSGMSRAMRELSSTSKTSNGFGGLPAAASSRWTLDGSGCWRPKCRRHSATNG